MQDGKGWQNHQRLIADRFRCLASRAAAENSYNGLRQATCILAYVPTSQPASIARQVSLY
jgi:hypothetical protein